ncbi:hypothetical protein, partial [Xanthomonas hortorum]|uniref:hypothetical protein n=1 Tax=Xanthomonas hortorum TaxID=56454 RepID=UPI00398194E0
MAQAVHDVRYLDTDAFGHVPHTDRATEKAFKKAAGQLSGAVSSPLAGPCGGMDAATEPPRT